MTTMIQLRDLLKISPAALILGLMGCGEEAANPPAAPSAVSKPGESAAQAVEKVIEKGEAKAAEAGEKAAAAIEKAGDKAAEAVEKAADKAADALKPEKVVASHA
jgi:hypothetical protein